MKTIRISQPVLALALVAIFLLANLYWLLPADLPTRQQDASVTTLTTTVDADHQEQATTTTVQQPVTRLDTSPTAPATAEQLWASASGFSQEQLVESATLLGLAPEQVTPMTVNFARLNQLAVGDLVPLELPDTVGNYHFVVTTVTRQGALTQVQGHLEGMDIGFGVTATFDGERLYATYLLPEGKYNIESINNMILLTDNMRSIDDNVHDRDAIMPSGIH